MAPRLVSYPSMGMLLISVAALVTATGVSPPEGDVRLIEPTASCASQVGDADAVTLAPVSAVESSVEPGTLLRVGGANRFETAILLSQLAYPDPCSAGAVVLSRSDLYPDALSGGPLGAAVDGPVLITPPTALREDVLAEIARVLPAGETVYLLGSNDALSAQVETAVTAAGYQTSRIAGANRFETSLLIAGEVERIAGTPEVLFVATGLNFPDALAAGSIAASFNPPEYHPDVPTAVVVLSRDYSLTPAVEDYLADIYFTNLDSVIWAAGGQASIAVWDAFGCEWEDGCYYFMGANRYQTAAWMAYAYESPTGFGLTTGQNFPDALTGAPLLGANDWPVLLVPPDGPIPTHPDDSVREFLSDKADTITDGLVLGSPASVSTNVTQDVCDLIGIANCDVPFSPLGAPLGLTPGDHSPFDSQSPPMLTPSYRPIPQTAGDLD